MSGGQPPAAALPVTARQLELLQAYSQRRNIGHQYKLRSRIIVLASQGQANKVVARQLGVTNNVVKTWRGRWLQAYDQLCGFEQGLSPENPTGNKQLLDRMLTILSDQPRSGKPKRITLAQQQQIVALACEDPQDYGIPMTQWNREMLAHVIKAKGIVEQISPRYVSEILKKDGSASS